MKNIYKYLFYRLYTWNLKTWGERDYPQVNALLGMTFMMFANIWSLSRITIELLLGKEFLMPDKILVSVFFLAILLLNSTWTIRGKRYKKFVANYSKESKEIRFRNFIILIVYTVISFILFLIPLY